jgi:hypothetical protein
VFHVERSGWREVFHVEHCMYKCVMAYTVCFERDAEIADCCRPAGSGVFSGLFVKDILQFCLGPGLSRAFHFVHRTMVILLSCGLVSLGPRSCLDVITGSTNMADGLPRYTIGHEEL